MVKERVTRKLLQENKSEVETKIKESSEDTKKKEKTNRIYINKKR